MNRKRLSVVFSHILIHFPNIRTLVGLVLATCVCAVITRGDEFSLPTAGWRAHQHTFVSAIIVLLALIDELPRPLFNRRCVYAFNSLCVFSYRCKIK